MAISVKKLSEHFHEMYCAEFDNGVSSDRESCFVSNHYAEYEQLAMLIKHCEWSKLINFLTANRYVVDTLSATKQENSADKVKTYADGFGNWHAIVPVQNHESVTRAMARREIKWELRDRASREQLEDPNFLKDFAVKFVGYTEDGRAEYKEI